MLTEKIVVDDRDTSRAPFAARSLHIVRQTNGILRIHGSNGGYLFSLIRAFDGKVYAYSDGFGCNFTKKEWAPAEINYMGGK